MFCRLKAMIKKEFYQTIRDKRSLGVLLIIPALTLALFGYALNFDLKNISLAVYDADKTQASHNFIDELLHTGYFDLKYYLDDIQEIDQLLIRNKATVAMVIPRNFSNDILHGTITPVQFIVDGTNANTAGTAMGYINALMEYYTSTIHIETTTLHSPIELQSRIWYNPGLTSALFFVPGLIGFILMITTVISTALSIVREKENGTMEQLTVSPMRPLEMLLGKTIPYIVISLIGTAVILWLGNLLFGVTVAGSYWLLLLVTLLFIFAGLSLGLLISTISDSQQVAFFTSIMVTMLPTFVLSGFIFPIENMPSFIQLITHIIPARYYIFALRAIILKGVGISVFWEQAIALIIFGTIILTLSTFRMYRKKL